MGAELRRSREVGGDDLFGFSSGGSSCPEESAPMRSEDSPVPVAHSGERMLAGGECDAEPNSGEAAVVGGNNLFGSSPPAETPSPELARRYRSP